MRSIERSYFELTNRVNSPDHILPEIKGMEDESESTTELVEKYIKYQAEIKRIEAELKRREIGGEIKNFDDTDKLVLEQSREMNDVPVPEELKVIQENKEEEFDNQRIEELEEIIAGDEYKKRTLEYLERAGVVKYKAGQVYFDMNTFESKNFSNQFRLAYICRIDGADKRGSKPEVYRIFSGVKAIGLSEKFTKDKEPQELSELNFGNSLEKIKDSFIKKLVAKRIIKNKDGLKIFDIDRFKNYEPKHVLGTIGKKSIYSSRNVVYDFLKDLEVVSANDYALAGEDKSKLKPIPLFNVPENVEEAFDEDFIKNKKYYLNFWDIGDRENNQTVIRWEKHKDFESESGEKINPRELYLATKIFREFNGNRENGVLMVDNPKDGSRKKITYDWILENISRVQGIEKGIHSFLQDNCPNLIKNGLLKYSDFEIQTTRGAAEIARKEYFPKAGSKFQVSTDKATYFISSGNNFIYKDRKIPLENIKVAILDNKTLGIISVDNGTEKLEYTIDMLSDEEILNKKALLKKKDVKDLSKEERQETIFANREDLDGKIKEFEKSSLISRKTGESDVEYEKRTGYILDYNHVKDVSDNLLNEHKISIHNLSWREQVWLSAAEHELRLQNRYDEFIKFVDEYKLDGIKTFLSCENDIDDAVRILEINKKLGKEDASLVFGKVAEFNDVLVRADENLSKYFYKESEKRDFNEFREKLLKKMHQIIFDFSDNLEAGKKKSDEDVSVLLDDLSKANSDIEILSAFLGSLDESERFEQLEKVKDLVIEKTNKLSDEEINKIATLAEASWSENVQERQVNEKFVENLLKSLRSGLENLTEADEMNILKYKEEIVGVIKFKRKENGALEAESVNVNPEVKGLNIGKFIFEIIKQKAEKDDIYLYGCVKTKVVSHYVNELGAVGYGFNDDDLDADEPSLRMKIAKTNHEKTESSNSFDIERKFRINDPKELLEFREFLNENLFATDNNGELVEDQNSNEKYSVVKFDWEGDDKKTAHVFLKKNE